MADRISIYTPTQDVLNYTGKGFVTGIIVTSSSTTPSSLILYDQVVDGGGTKILEVQVNANAPVIIFFEDRFAPRFFTGLWVELGAAAYATIYSRCPNG